MAFSINDINGGFLATLRKDNQLAEVSDRLTQSGANIHRLDDDGVLLASWSGQTGQGVWAGTDAAVAFDLDLTNRGALEAKVGFNGGRTDLGQLLWLLYQSHGVGFIDMLRGAFAFALWDRRQRKMLVVTDPFGIRPVVYSETSGNFTAASRIKYLSVDQQVDTTIDPEAIYNYLFFQAICSPATIHKGIRKLPPGEALQFDSGGLRQFTHYDVRYQPGSRTDDLYWRRAVRDAVEKAVDVYVPLTAPEKTGCYLSGGTDSSSIAGFYTKLTGFPAKTFSIGFDEPEYNEMDYAHIAARHFGTKQHDYFVTPRDVLDLIHALPTLYDEPFGNSSVVPAFFCAKLAKENGVDLLLGGDGGDEIFGGNERYVRNLVFSLYHRFPALLRQNLLEPLLASAPDRAIFFKAKRYIRRANFQNPDRFFSYNLLAETAPDEVFKSEYLELVDTECFLKLARNLYQKASPAHETDRLLYIDMKFTITDNDLRKVTRMAEAAGVKVRYPMLDRDLVDFTATIPPQLKVKWGKGRYIFKRAMEGFLPAEIISKTKHGFGLPIAVWFKKDPQLNELLYDVLFSESPLITQWVKKDFLHWLRTEFENDNTTYYGKYLWVVLILELWAKENKHHFSELVRR